MACPPAAFPPGPRVGNCRSEIAPKPARCIGVDSYYSYDWLSEVAPGSVVLFGVIEVDIAIVLSIVLAIGASTVGALITCGYSLDIVFYESEKIAKITDHNMRLLKLINFWLKLAFVGISFFTIYGTDLISNYASLKRPILALVVVLSSDFLLVGSNWLWSLALVEKRQGSEFQDAVESGMPKKPKVTVVGGGGSNKGKNPKNVTDKSRFDS